MTGASLSAGCCEKPRVSLTRVLTGSGGPVPSSHQGLGDGADRCEVGAVKSASSPLEDRVIDRARPGELTLYDDAGSPAVLPVAGDLGSRVAAALRAASGRVSLLVDADGSIAWVSDNVDRLLGCGPARVVGTSLFDWYSARDAAHSRSGLERSRANPDLAGDRLGVLPRTAEVRRADGALTLVEVVPTPLLMRPDISGVLVEWRPVPDRRNLLNAIDALAGGRPALDTVSAAANLIESAVSDLTVVAFSVVEDTWTLLRPVDDVDAESLASALPTLGDTRWSQPWVRLDDEDPRFDETTGQPVSGRQIAAVPLPASDGDLLGALVLLRRNIDVLRLTVESGQSLLHVAVRMCVLALSHARSNQALRRDAETDELTGLTNRAGFNRHVDELVAAHETDMTIMYVDLDDFKPINDRYGHAAGDEVLVQIGQRLRRTVRDSDLVCRVGGDEFAVIYRGEMSEAFVALLTDRVRRILTGDVWIGPQPVSVGVSIGVATGDPRDRRTIMIRADAALYQAKRAGKNQTIGPGR